ncbi:MAG: peroxiredoxin [Pirellulales bacterium]|nr:peroxiredoxin [Pirellulales bacterium]
MSIIGQAAPDFSMEAVENGAFKQVSLKDYEGKWLVLFFYPLDFTFVCPTEILAFSSAVDRFKGLNAELLGVSVDSKFTHLAWTEKPQAEGGISGLAYPLASDLSKQVATRYNVLAAGGVALRGLFIVDPNGIIQHATVNNLAVGRSVDETLRVLQAFQYVAEHGEVCPAGWEPGGATMKADWDGSKEYFKSASA